MLRRVVLTAVAVMAATLAGPFATPASANVTVDESYPRPGDGVYHVIGHGWGHGHGLSQWGAEGAASQGVAYGAILDAYYPGTGTAKLAAAPIRVLIEADDATDVVVEATAGLAVRDLAKNVRYALPTDPSRWRLVSDAAGFHVHYWNSGWRLWSSGSVSTWAGPMQFEASGPLRLVLPDGTKRDYRGALRAVRSGSAQRTVNVLPLDQYLYGVVPRESSSSWHADALRAQSVAARSYAAYKRAHAPSGQPWDICSSTSCQVYGGVRVVTSSGSTVPLEAASTNAAVDATANAVRTYGGGPIFAEFSSSNGGWSTAGSFPYLAPRSDPWDAIASPHHDWDAQFTAAGVEARYPSIGRLLRIRVTERDGNGDWGGRVKQVVFEGANGSVTGTGSSVYTLNTWPASADGLRGTWFKILPTTSAPDFSGSLLGVTANAVVRPGYTTAVSFDVRNVGNLDWPVNGGVRSALSDAPSPSYDAATWITSTRPGPLTANVTSPGATVVRPGQVARFRFTLAGNGRAEGGYDETFGVVWESKFWMALDVPLSYTVKKLFAGAFAAAAPGLVVPGHGTTAAYVDLRNTGDIAWPVGSAVRLTTSGSPSADPSWISPTRPGALRANVSSPSSAEIGPGEVGRFPFVLNGNGRAPGSGAESFGMVWEGRAGSTVQAPVAYEIRNVFTGHVAPPPSLLVPRTGRTPVTVDVTNTGNLTWPVGGAVRVVAASGSPSRSSTWLAPTRPGAVRGNVFRPAASSVLPGEVARFTFDLAGNGRPVGTRATETFGFVFEGVASLPSTATVTYTVRDLLAASLVQRPSPLYLPRSGEYAAYLDLRNDGTAAWPVGGAVRLTGSSSSPSRTPSWLSPTRPGTILGNRSHLGATSVAPGEIARFRLPLSGNGRATGTKATETFGVVWDGVGSFAARVAVPYVVEDRFTGRLAGVAQDLVVPSAGTARAYVDVANTGNLAWPVGGAVDVATSSTAAHAASWVATYRPGHVTGNLTRPGATTVLPGETARFAFDLGGNGRAAGSYGEHLRFVWESRAWLPLAADLAYRVG